MLKPPHDDARRLVCAEWGRLSDEQAQDWRTLLVSVDGGRGQPRNALPLPHPRGAREAGPVRRMNQLGALAVGARLPRRARFVPRTPARVRVKGSRGGG